MGRVLVVGAALGGRPVCQWQVARQADQRRQPLLLAQTGHQRHGAALREAHQHDALGRDAAFHFTGNEGLDGGL